MFLLLASAGCTEPVPDFPRIGLARTSDGNGLVVHLATCPDETVDAVEVSKINGAAVGDEDDETLWRIEAEGVPGPLAKVEVGSVPPGFREVVPLRQSLRQHQSANVVVEGEPGAELQLGGQWDDYPRNGRIYWAGNRLSEADFAAEVFEVEPDVCN